MVREQLRALHFWVPVLLALSVNAWAETVVVHIENYTYTPATVRIKPGDTVRWVNDEKRTSHSILFPAENNSESERLFPGEFWERKFTKKGRYAYLCGPHPEMKGAVIVDE